MSSPHDALFEYVFSQPEHAASELRAVLPAALCARLDWGSLELQPASFIDERLSGREADLLFTVRRLLSLRFGAVPDTVRDQVLHAPPERLDIWAERVITAQSLEEVLG